MGWFIVQALNLEEAILTTWAYTPEIPHGLHPDTQRILIEERVKVGRAVRSWPVLVSSLDEGDHVAVAGPGYLAQTEAKVFARLTVLESFKVPLIDATTGEEVNWSEPTIRTVTFLRLAAQEIRTRAATAAREAGTGIPGRRARDLPAPENALVKDWRDPRWPAVAVAKRAGLSVRSMYNRYGPRKLLPAVALLLTLSGCGNPNVEAQSRTVLEDQGYTNVKVSPVRWRECSPFQRRMVPFEATTAAGRRVTGTVCSGAYFNGFVVQLEASR